MSDMNQHNIKEALQWIVSLFHRYQVPYQAVGGLAAQGHGAKRPLVDIDIFVPMEAAQKMFPEIEPYLIRTLHPSRGQYWEITYLELSYQGIPISLADSSNQPRIYNTRDNQWEELIIDYGWSDEIELYGVPVMVMAKEALIAYKSILDREVDRVDIQEMLTGPGEAAEKNYAELTGGMNVELNTSRVDAERQQDLLENLEKRGFRFTTMEELGDTEEARRKLYVLNDRTAVQDNPNPDAHAWETFEIFNEEVCSMGWYKPAGQMVAIDTASGDWAAMIAVTRFEGSAHADILHLGVERQYAGLGLDETLLALAVSYAHKELDARLVHIEVGRNDLHTLTILDRIGYTRIL